MLSFGLEASLSQATGKKEGHGRQCIMIAKLIPGPIGQPQDSVDEDVASWQIIHMANANLTY